MGKQRRTKGTARGNTKTANSVDWELRARELVQAGICSPLILDHRSVAGDRRTTPPNWSKNVRK